MAESRFGGTPVTGQTPVSKFGGVPVQQASRGAAISSAPVSKFGGKPVQTSPAPAVPPPQDEMISSMFGLKREPSGQTYFEAPPPLPTGLDEVSLPVGFGNDLLNMGGGMARPLVGGVRNALVGAATLPADIASAFGSDVFQPTAEAIRENIPQVRQSGILGEIGQIVAQYAAPAKIGADLARAAIKTPGVIQYLAKMLGAGVGDAIATDTSQASTIGDSIPLLPTGLEPDDSPLEKRAKVGAETMFVQPAADVLIGGAKKIGQGVSAVKEYAKPYTAKGKEDLAAQVIKNTASDPVKAAATIDETLASVPDDGFKPLTGDASMDPGLLRAQKSVSNTNQVGDQILSNENNVAQQFSDTTTPSGTDRTPELRKAVETEAETQIAPARAAVASSNQALADVEGQLKTIAEDTARNKGGKTAASESIDQTFREVNEKLTKAKNKLFSEVDPDGSLKKDGTDFVAKIDGIKLQEGQAKDALPSDIINDVKKLAGEEGEGNPFDIIDGATGESIAKKTTPEVSFRFLVNMRQRLSDEIGRAVADSQGARVENLKAIKNIVNEEINGFAQGVGAEDAARLDAAFDNYANVFAPTLKEGQAGKMRQAINSNKPGMAPASATAGRFLSPGMGSKERVKSLKNVISQAESPEEGAAAVRSYLISDMAESVTDGAKIDPARLLAWTEKNREVLIEFPEVKREIAQLTNRVKNGSAAKKQIEQDILAATEGLERTTKDVNTSALGTIMKEEDPVKAVATIMGGANKRQRMKQVISAAKKDTSGQAMEGLKDAVKLHLRNQLSQSTTDFTGKNLKPSFAKLVEMQEKNPEVMGVLEDIYGADSKEMQSLKQIRTKLEILSRPSRVQGTAGSPTKALEQNEKEVESVLAATLAQNFKQNRILKTVFSMFPSPEEGVRRLVIDALTDPQLAKTMLLRPTEANAPRIQMELKTYISNNILGTSEDSRQDNQENDKIKAKQ